MPSEGGIGTDPPRRRDERLREEPAQPLTEADVGRHVRETCGLPSTGPTVGAEVEWLVVDLRDPGARPPVEALAQVLGPVELPGHSRITFEPGGQIELSSIPACSPEDVQRALAGDLALVREALAAHGWGLSAAARDDSRAPARINPQPRYAAMERWFLDGGWDSAPDMMCNTAAVQVNVGCGPDPATTWTRAHRLAPLLAAIFASSPSGGWESGRLRAWAGLDPSRTDSAHRTGEPVGDWTEFALEARTMLWQDGSNVRRTDGEFTFREWIEGSPAAPRKPELDDLELHLSTLFPPIRLKGWIEVRVIDMPPHEWWPVPVALVAALLCSEGSAEEPTWLAPTEDISWQEAARIGLRSPELAVAAARAMEEAVERLHNQSSPLADLVHRFSRSFVGQRHPSSSGFRRAGGSP